MWWMWLLRKLKKRKSNKFPLYFIISLVVVFIFISVYSAINSNLILRYLAQREAHKILNKASDKYSSVLHVNLNEKFPELNQNQTPQQNDLVRGNGLNLLLIDQISAESYVKELLSLYRDSELGKLSNTKYHMPLTTLLGIHTNESGYYEGSGVLPKSYLPYDSSSKKVYWNTSYRGLPKEALTLSKFDSSVAKALGIDQSYNGVGNSTYVNVFNINADYFGPSSYVSSLTGYGMKSGRNRSDKFFLPDNLAYMDVQYSAMMSRLNLSGVDNRVASAMYSIWHNAGETYLPYTSGFGVAPASTKIKTNNQSTLSEYSKHSQYIAKSMVASVDKFKSKNIPSYTKDEAIPLGVILLLEDGYYLSERAYKAFTEGGLQISSKYNLNRRATMVKVWNKFYGTNLTTDQVMSELRKKVKNIPEVYPQYTASIVSNIYGDKYLEDSKGPLWKLATETSSVYKNKINGEDPRVLHVVNLETTGHMVSAVVQGSVVYENLLKLSGVNVDVTNPSQYYNDKQNEYIPPSGDLANILEKIGATPVSTNAMTMLNDAYKVSGFWYVWGGEGHLVSDEAGYQDVLNNAGNNKTLLNNLYNRVYVTKDGTDPRKLANRRKDNLLYADQRMFDCSGFVTWAFNQTVGKKLGIKLSGTTATLVNTTKMTTISESSAKAGDVLVRRSSGSGHIAFFLSKNQGQSLTASETKTNDTKAAKGKRVYWVLEAQETGKKVGIYCRNFSSSYKFRRINGI